MTGAVWTRLSAAGWESEAGVSVNLLVLFSLRRKEHHSPFWKRQKVFVLFLCGKKKNKKEAAGHSENRKQIYIHLYFCIRFFALRFFQKAGQSRLTVSVKKSCRGDGARYRAEKNFSLRNAERTDMCSCFFSRKSRWTPWNSYDTIKVTNQKGGT